MNEIRKNLGPGRTFAGSRHEAIASVLRARIVEGRLNPQDRLPSFDSLALEFNVSTITIRQALSALQNDGFVERRHGVGTFVADIEVPKANLMRLATLWGPIVETGKVVELRRLESSRRDRSLLLGRDAEMAASSDAYWYLKRLQLDNGQPFAILQAEIDWSVYQRSPAKFEVERAMLQVLDSISGLNIACAKQYLSIQVADVEESKLLNIALGSPVGKIKRVVIDERAIAIALVTITYPGSLVRLEMSLTPPDLL